MSIDGDGYYMPYVPARPDVDVDDIEDQTAPAAEDLEVRHPPVGLSRAERKDWMRDEATRIARLQNRTRRNPLARTPPRGLRGAGRREWRQADRENRKDWLARERAKTGQSHGVGVLIVAAVLAALLLVRIFVIDGSPMPQSPPTAPVVSKVAPTTTYVPNRGE